MSGPYRWRRTRRTRRPPAPLVRFVSKDPPALLALAVLVGLGELNLLAIGASDLAAHQLLAVGCGLLLIVCAQRVSGQTLPWLGWGVYLAALGLLLGVDVSGSRAYGAQRWVAVGSIELQPSELAKLGLLLVLASVLSARRVSRRRVAAATALTAAPMALTLLQPDLSTTGLLGSLLFAALLLARVPVRVVAAVAAAAVAAAPLALVSLHSYQSARLHAFLSGASDPQGAGYSTLQAHIAIASGGFFGTARAPIHQLLAEYLPARHTDLAFASLIEQWGLAAGALALLAVVVLVWRLIAAARGACDPVSGLVAGTLAVLLVTEVALSVAGNLGLTPLAGVPFPLLSFGGTAAAAHLAAVGLVLGARGGSRPRFLPAVFQPRIAPRLVRLTGFTLISLVIGLGWLSYHDQQALGATFSAYGMRQMTRCTPLPAARGLIEDRHGAPLAVNDAGRRVYAVPALLLAGAGQVAQLASALGRPEKDVAALLLAHPASPALELGSFPPEVAARVDALHLPGIVIVPSPLRHYPTGALLGPVLGFTGVITADDLPSWKGYPPGSVIGRAGIERQYDSLLRGRDGELCVLVNPQNRPVAVSEVTLPVPGDTLRLSLDLDLQRVATAAMLSEFENPGPGNPHADLAGGVVLGAATGQVLAMVSIPSFDDNIFGPPLDLPALERFTTAPGSPMLEHVTQVAAPPGSTFKLVVGTADTIYNAIPPQQVIPTGYWFRLGASSFHGWGNLPPQNLTQAIAWSNDVYFYKLGLALGPERMADAASRLGAGTRTGIDLPGEVAGLVGTPQSMEAVGESWYPATTAFMGIGQGYVTATPLQVARWTAAVASGRLLTPRLGLAWTPAPGQPYVALAQPAPATLDFAGLLRPVQQGMRQAVTGGTATLLNSIPLEMGGKTGSAEDPSTPGGVNAWFTCAGPMNGNPEVVATFFFRGGGEGHAVAEPVAAQVMTWYAQHRAEIRAAVDMLPPPSARRIRERGPLIYT